MVPVGIFLYGAGSVTTVDLNRLSNPELTHTTLRKFLEYHKNGKLEKFLPGILEERLKIVLAEAENPSADFYNLLDNHNITYMVMDARKLHLPDTSIDLITSNNTFEHIYPEVLEGILKEFKRLGKSGGVMSHAIDMSDHFAHMDTSITIYNFLKFSDVQWRFIDNSIQPQNRMRIYHYREMYSNQNISVTDEINREFNLEDYRRVNVNDKFSSYPIEENAVSHTQMISVM